MLNNSILNDVLYFFIFAVVQTITQIIGFFGQIIVFGLLLYVLSSMTRKVYASTVGAKAEIYITGFIGTPVHELSHALFCLIFRHKISDIKLFNPSASNGSIGYVMHSYDKRSWYEQAGNFFIGIAPILIGAIVIYLLLSLIIPTLKEKIFYIAQNNNLFLIDSDNSVKGIIVASFNGMLNLFISTFLSIKEIFQTIITSDNIKTINFWVFIYITISIASHMELSPADITHALRGIIYIFAFLLILNAVLLFISLVGGDGILSSAKVHTTIFFNMFLLKSKTILLIAFLFSLVNFIITYLVLTPVSLIKYKKLITIIR